MSEQKRKGVGGLWRWYIGAVGAGAKGAMGTESSRQSIQMIRAGWGQMWLGVCPRCKGRTLRKEGSVYRCLHDSVCGFQANGKAEVEQAFDAMKSVDIRVLALSKGEPVNLASHSASARRMAWFCWAITFLLIVYGLSWAFDGQWFYAGWVCLVSVYTALKALTYAFQSLRSQGVVLPSKLEFLANPQLWFPTADRK